MRELIAEHPGPTSVFWMEVSFPETVRRHQTRQEPIDVTPEPMRGWHTPLDLLGVDGEHTIAETATLEDAVARVQHVSGLSDQAALTPCRVLRPRCAEKRTPPPNDGDAHIGIRV